MTEQSQKKTFVTKSKISTKTIAKKEKKSKRKTKSKRKKQMGVRKRKKKKRVVAKFKRLISSCSDSHGEGWVEKSSEREES